MYINDDMSVKTLAMVSEYPTYETLWVGIEHNGIPYVYRNGYHPPKPICNFSTFMEFLQTNIDHIMTVDCRSVNIMCGGSNQLSVANACIRTG